MFTSLSARDFKAVPHLETSLLMQHHPDGVTFSVDKPNVVVGPNGAGKSALLSALALHTLSFYGGVSALDRNYVGRTREGETYWARDGWRRDYAFLPGLTCGGDLGPAFYYRPGHIPGNDDSITAAMMCGYFEEARAYGTLVDNKSSGQQSQALLQKIRQALDGDLSELRYGEMNWNSGTKPKDLSNQRHVSDFEYHEEALKARCAGAGSFPVVLMDEPEQSLDAKAELSLWKQIERTDTNRLQVIVATHSLYPLLNPDKFHLIEAVPGYAQEVQALLQG